MKVSRTLIFITIVYQVLASNRNARSSRKVSAVNGGGGGGGGEIITLDQLEKEVENEVNHEEHRRIHHSNHNHNNKSYNTMHRQQQLKASSSSASTTSRLTKTAHKIYEDILPMIRQFSSAPPQQQQQQQQANIAAVDLRHYWKTSGSNSNLRHQDYLRLNDSFLSRVSRASPLVVKKRTAVDDHVSKNISMLLEDLLKSYESSQLPTHGQGLPTVVKTNILIRSMGPVSELDMEYSMDCYFRQYWRDKRLSFKGPIKSLSLSIKMLERIWRPDTYFYNGKNSHVHTITVPNKLLRLNQDGDILYSMRLTIKASCPMQLRNFPMDRQSCPLSFGSYGYTSNQLRYEWQNNQAVNFVPGMALSQFDVNSFPQGNFTFYRREGEFSVLQVSFNLQRHTGYFLIQVYVPCILIVVLSWVGFWIHREATSDRVGLGITTVLTLSTISLDSRTDLPKVKYATALDWFLLGCFFYCIATLLEFAGVHYFTKVGSGEIHLAEATEWEDIEETEEIGSLICSNRGSNQDTPQKALTKRRSSSMICPIYNDPAQMFRSTGSGLSTMERQTQTEPPRVKLWKQVWLCFMGDVKFRQDREAEVKAKGGRNRYVNSVSLIDRTARVIFPASFFILNILYWLAFYTYQKDFAFTPLKGGRAKLTN